ncbi:hypothetical protein SH139x_000668 [Planctomycetaceae bacterium SH139]
MTRRRRLGLSPSLFPFLAVLVCTLGTLILLLALVSQKAEEAAQQLVDSESETARELAEQQTWQAQQLIAYRDRQTEILEERRGELAHLEDHSRRLRESLEQLKDELAAATESNDANSLAAKRQRLASLESEIEKQRAALAERSEQDDGRPPRVVIVPYEGNSGTQRRPIYVECTDEAIILQPEGVRLTAEHLGGPLGPGNPLDAALRAIRGHWQKLDVNAPPPYPLLLVRPNGIHAYAACRIAMDAWDDQFGYELVPADMELAFPQPDPELKANLLAAIENSLKRSSSQLANAPRRNRFVGAAPTTSGSGSGPGSYQYGSNDGSGTDNGTNNGSEFSDGSSGNGSNLAGNGGLPNSDDLNGAFDGAYNADPNGGVNGDQPWLGDSPPTTDIARLRQELAGRATGQPGNGTSTGNGGSAGNAELNTPMNSLAGNEQAATGEGAFSGNNPADQPGNFGQTGSPEAQATNGQTTGGQAAGGQAAGTQAAGGQTAGGQSAAAAAGQPPVNASGPGGGGTSSAQSQPAQTFSAAIEERARAQANNPPRQAPPSDQLPDLNAGNNWALPDSFSHLRGPTVVRELQLACHGQYLELAGERGGAAVTIPIRNGLIDQAVRELAGEIRRRVEDWGPVMRDGRWEPVLSVRVAADGESRFRQLEMLMRNSGVRVERKRTR